MRYGLIAFVVVLCLSFLAFTAPEPDPCGLWCSVDVTWWEDAGAGVECLWGGCPTESYIPTLTVKLWCRITCLETRVYTGDAVASGWEFYEAEGEYEDQVTFATAHLRVYCSCPGIADDQWPDPE